MTTLFRTLLYLLGIPLLIGAQSAAVCPRYPVGSTIPAPEDLYSVNGVLNINFTYQTSTDPNGNTLFCFTAADGSQSPTLHVNPGDRIAMTVVNAIPTNAPLAMNSAMVMPRKAELANGPGPHVVLQPDCTASTMAPSSVNVHFHGTNTPATCGQDEVIHTIINSGETFQYNLQIPADEPPGLYWYHPHVHGISESAVLGGASGAIVVEGIQNVNAATAGLNQQLLIVRDNFVPGYPLPDDAPSKDLSLNYVPVPYPQYIPAKISMMPGEQQFWRVLNASADTILDLQVTYDGQVQPLQIVALDGVPTGSQDGTTAGTSVTQNDVFIPPAGRAEFVVNGPALTVKSALLSTLNIDTGPDGDNDPARPLAMINVNGVANMTHSKLRPELPHALPKARFSNLANANPVTQRNLYFSEMSLDPGDPDASVIFFITVAGQNPAAFNPDNPPSIVTTAGAVEDWVIENHSSEDHEFHIHQIHFLQTQANGIPVSNGQYLDTINVPYWSGAGPYPSVTLRMDFRGVTPGDFVYHCHILAHEDAGMMATIRVTGSLPAATCDVNSDQVVNVTDVQLIINQALGLIPAVNDINQDGQVNVADVQIVINAALGLGCSY